ncbi:MAG: HAD-IC family P-type ATPase, partial [Bacteroidetes bacterium]|nr:HAD-IC family P-type ATPase [Bacteroidota bacterium]
RVVQERTYKSISFHRDYKSYFPIAVNVVTAQGIQTKNLNDLKEKDIVQLHSNEIIPADAIAVKGKAKIDYSFVTGESEPVSINSGEMLYAGGKQVGEELTIQIIKPVAGSYLTSLWNHYAFSKNKTEQNINESRVQLLSKYFTYILFLLAGITAAYWAMHDSSKILPSVSAMLIVACPCALLLSATFTNGNLLRILSDNGLFLRDASVIEQLGNINDIVFDKTGTLTQGGSNITCSGHQLTTDEEKWVYSVAKSSKHPYSKALAAYFNSNDAVDITGWKEITGKGIEAYFEGNLIKIGSAEFVGIAENDKEHAPIYVRINNNITAFYLQPAFREAIPEIMPELKKDYTLSLLSGDNSRQKDALQQLFGTNSELLFEQKPLDKLNYIETRQHKGKKVLMLGDGLNDAGALQQSDVGITLADDINNFTPSCDAILNANNFIKFPSLLKLAKSGKAIIAFSFIISILYNIIGLLISVQGKMSPMIAAILMPISTLSIVLITTGISSIAAKYFHLSLKAGNV